MTSAIPYQAPWQTGFERYATQFVPIASSGTVDSFSIVVPSTQFWRLVAAQLGWFTSAVVANRVPRMVITAAIGPNPATWTIGSPVIQTATQTSIVVWGPYLDSYTNTGVPGQPFGSVTLPDVIWGPGTTWAWFLTNDAAGDLRNAGSLLIEVYTEERPGVLVPADVVASPVLA